MARFGQTCFGFFTDWEGVNIKGDEGRVALTDMAIVSLMLHYVDVKFINRLIYPISPIRCSKFAHTLTTTTWCITAPVTLL